MIVICCTKKHDVFPANVFPIFEQMKQELTLTFILLLLFWFGYKTSETYFRDERYFRDDKIDRGDDDDDYRQAEIEYKQKVARLKRQKSKEDAAWKETMQTWGHPSYERELTHVESDHIARMWDRAAEETQEPRFMGFTRNPIPIRVHDMAVRERVQLIDRELTRLRNLQIRVKDNIDLWVKNGANPNDELMSPQSRWWEDPRKVEFENHEILREIDRLEKLKRDLFR